jgi:hypothetical protein
MLRTSRILTLLLLAAVPAGAQGPIPVGQTAAGELSGADRKADGKSFDTWRFTARPGATYMVTLRSEDFDAYLWAGPARGDNCDPCQRSDDFSDNNDSRVVLEAETGGPQVIRATTFQAGESGRYTLVVDEVEPLPPPGAGPSPASRGGGVLQPDATATGVLDEGDRRAPYNQRQQNALYDVWTYRGTGGEPLTLSLRSDDFDTFLRLYRWEAGRWQLLSSNDDEAGGETNSRVAVTLPADGEYQVHTAAFRENAAGAYTLTVIRGPDPASAVAAAPPADPDELPFLAPGGGKEGELAAGDAVGEDGASYDAYRYFASAGETATFELATEYFDAVLRIGVRQDGVWREVARDDDGGGGTQSELTITFPAQAEYELRAGAVAAGAAGPYSLFATTDIHAGIEAGMPPGTLTIGHTSVGRLEDGDERGDRGAPLDVWTVLGTVGNRLTIDLRSNDFDPLVRIYAERPDGTWQLLGENDDDGVDMDSRLTVTLPATGRYRIHASAYRPEARGQYRLSASY